jgi:hypothetical protein
MCQCERDYVLVKNTDAPLGYECKGKIAVGFQCNEGDSCDAKGCLAGFFWDGDFCEPTSDDVFGMLRATEHIMTARGCIVDVSLCMHLCRHTCFGPTPVTKFAMCPIMC